MFDLNGDGEVDLEEFDQVRPPQKQLTDMLGQCNVHTRSPLEDSEQQHVVTGSRITKYISMTSCQRE